MTSKRHLWCPVAEAYVGRVTAPDPRNLDPKAMAVKQFHVRFNERELLLAQMVADMEDTSKQRLLRRIVREYCERKLKAAGVPHP